MAAMEAKKKVEYAASMAVEAWIRGTSIDIIKSDVEEWIKRASKDTILKKPPKPDEVSSAILKGMAEIELFANSLNPLAAVRSQEKLAKDIAKHGEMAAMEAKRKVEYAASMAVEAWIRGTSIDIIKSDVEEWIKRASKDTILKKPPEPDDSSDEVSSAILKGIQAVEERKKSASLSQDERYSMFPPGNSVMQSLGERGTRLGMVSYGASFLDLLLQSSTKASSVESPAFSDPSDDYQQRLALAAVAILWGILLVVLLMQQLRKQNLVVQNFEAEPDSEPNLNIESQCDTKSDSHAIVSMTKIDSSSALLDIRTDNDDAENSRFHTKSMKSKPSTSNCSTTTSSTVTGSCSRSTNSNYGRLGSSTDKFKSSKNLGCNSNTNKLNNKSESDVNMINRSRLSGKTTVNQKKSKKFAKDPIHANNLNDESKSTPKFIKTLKSTNEATVSSSNCTTRLSGSSTSSTVTKICASGSGPGPGPGGNTTSMSSTSCSSHTDSSSRSSECSSVSSRLSESRGSSGSASDISGTPVREGAAL